MERAAGGDQPGFGSVSSYQAVSPATATLHVAGESESASSTITLAAGTVHTIVVLDGSKGLVLDDFLDAAGSGDMPAGGAATGFGSAVIAGHIDSRAGPGAFFRLSSLRAGDLIYARRADSTLAVFRVTAVRQFPKDSFPTSAVYGPTPDSELRLITCGGTFDYQAGSYLSNTLVYAVETN
jgi:hypothetical protein